MDIETRTAVGSDASTLRDLADFDLHVSAVEDFALLVKENLAATPERLPDPFNITLVGANCFDLQQQEKARQIISDFLRVCQWHYMAFDPAVHRRDHVHEYWRFITRKYAARDGIVVVGGNPDVVQADDVLIRTRRDPLLNALRNGGEFEQIRAKALLVLIYQLWEEDARYRLARTLGIDKCRITCSLFSDVRHVRNDIIHANGQMRSWDKLEILRDIWDVRQHIMWQLSFDMIRSLMQHINDLEISIQHDV